MTIKEFNLSEELQKVTDYTPCETSDPVFGIINKQELDIILKEFIKELKKAQCWKCGKLCDNEIDKLVGDRLNDN